MGGWVDGWLDGWYPLSLLPLGVWMLNCLGGQSQGTPPSKMTVFSQRRCWKLLLPIYSQEKSGASSGSWKTTCVMQAAGPPRRHWPASPGAKALWML